VTALRPTGGLGGHPDQIAAIVDEFWSQAH
jgi:hypothetical protein